MLLGMAMNKTDKSQKYMVLHCKVADILVLLYSRCKYVAGYNVTISEKQWSYISPINIHSKLTGTRLKFQQCSKSLDHPILFQRSLF